MTPTLGCEIEPNCTGRGERRDCGHIACNACTDDDTQLCLLCVPTDDELYELALSRREHRLARSAEPDWDAIVNDQLAGDEAAGMGLKDEQRWDF